MPHLRWFCGPTDRRRTGHPPHGFAPVFRMVIATEKTWWAVTLSGTVMRTNAAS